jgi:MinD superfamily P-loop ATPase
MQPEELVIISGKGGTGKTSITAALAECFPSKVLADCDVDAADLFLVLKVTETQIAEFQSGHVAEIDPEKCHHCGHCATLCRFEAIVSSKKGYEVDARACEGCKVCVNACPHHAIEWKEAFCGLWKESQTTQGTLFHASLYPGAENSGKLVSFVREKTRKKAVDEGIPLVLVDGPPGIGCPVIASVTGASIILVVTEPTPSGYHDLERVLVLAKHFQVPTYILINKADLETSYHKKMEDCAAKFGATVIGQLPYSPLFSKAQQKGQSVLTAFPTSPEAETLRSIAALLKQKMKMS